MRLQQIANGELAMHIRAKAHGYEKKESIFNVNDVLKQLPAEAKAERFAFMGDLWSEMRKRKHRADEPRALAGRWAGPNTCGT